MTETPNYRTRAMFLDINLEVSRLSCVTLVVLCSAIANRSCYMQTIPASKQQPLVHLPLPSKAFQRMLYKDALGSTSHCAS
jgi:hypothetical protein